MGCHAIKLSRSVSLIIPRHALLTEYACLGKNEMLPEFFPNCNCVAKMVMRVFAGNNPRLHGLRRRNRGRFKLILKTVQAGNGAAHDQSVSFFDEE